MDYPQARSILSGEPEYAEDFAEVLREEVDRYEPVVKSDTEEYGLYAEGPWKKIRNQVLERTEEVLGEDENVDQELIDILDELYSDEVANSGVRMEFNGLIQKTVQSTAEVYSSENSRAVSD